MNIAIVTDDFMYNTYNYKVNLHYVTPQNYIEVIMNNNIDCFLFVTCWKGLEGEWSFIAESEFKRSKLLSCVDLCKKQGVPTIFQSIEDPINYNIYIEIAKEFDSIFTSDVNCIEQYKKDSCNNNVNYLPYAINPLVHNPLNSSFDNKKDIIFAGSYMRKYPLRCKNTEVLFDGTLNSGNKSIKIYDRNLKLNNGVYFFPEKYSRFVHEGLDHLELFSEHKKHLFAFNLNSITKSPTMCSMRTYELQAMGVMQLSNYALSISNNFPCIPVLFNEDMVKNYLDVLTNDYIYSTQLENISRMFLNYRTDIIYEKMMASVNKTFKSFNPKVFLEDYGNKAFSTIVTNRKNSCYTVVDNVNEADYIIYLEPDMPIYPTYIDNIVSMFLFSDAKKIVVNEKIKPFNITDKGKVIAENLITSSLELLNFVFPTPFLGEYEFRNFKASIVIPVYNNGLFLKHRLLHSLKSSKYFENFELIIIDDNSTDQDTLDILFEISKNKNVKVLKIENGPTGSPSTGKNLGIMNASTDKIIFADPDNYYYGNRFDELIDNIGEDECIEASFEIMRENFEQPIVVSNNHLSNYSSYENIINSIFEVNTQLSTIYRKDVLDKTNLFVHNSLGEDTLLYEELHTKIGNIKYVNSVTGIYFAERSGSVTNVSTDKFFERSKRCFIEMKKQRNDTFNEIYRMSRADSYFYLWICKNFIEMRFDSEEVERKCFEQIVEIANILEIEDFPKKYTTNSIKTIESLIHIHKQLFDEKKKMVREFK